MTRLDATDSTFLETRESSSSRLPVKKACCKVSIHTDCGPATAGSSPYQLVLHKIDCIAGSIGPLNVGAAKLVRDYATYFIGLTAQILGEGSSLLALYFYKASCPLNIRLVLEYDALQLSALPHERNYLFIDYSDAVLAKGVYLFIV